MTEVDKLVLWILKHRCKKAFNKFTAWDIKHALLHAILLDCCVVLKDGDNFVGVVVAERDDEKREIYVQNILTTKRGLMPEFIKVFKTRFADYHIKARRKGKIVSYN